MTFKEKVALITGGGRGIGRAITFEFARQGASVAVNAMHRETTETVVKELLSTGYTSLAVPGDVSNSEEVVKMVEATICEFGKIDILVNCAGIGTPKRSVDLKEEEWDRVIDVNLKGTFLCAQTVGREMMKKGGGNIINISSTAGFAARPNRAAYCASKAGVILLTQVLAIEWASCGIRVNAIAPGSVKTDRILQVYKAGIYSEEDVLKRIPMRRQAEPREIAKAALFLASEDSSYITGQTIIVDGGWTAMGWDR